MQGMIDKELVRRRFARALGSYGREAVVQRGMARELALMAARHAGGEAFGSLLEIGCGSGLLTAELLDRFRIGRYWANDLVGESRHCIEHLFDAFPGTLMTFLEGDVEALGELPRELDAILSNATFQWLEDPARFFLRIARSLKPGGLLVFSSFGGGNMREIAELEGCTLGYHGPEVLAGIAGPSFELLASSSREEVLAFPSPEAVLRHIRMTGVGGLSRTTWTKGRHSAFSEGYRQRFPLPGGGVRLTYQPLWCCMRRLP